MKVKVKVYDGVKYWDGTEKVAEVEYDIKDYEVKQISDEEIAAMGFDTVDEFEEYLILTFENGETSTFCNSHVDLFRLICLDCRRCRYGSKRWEAGKAVRHSKGGSKSRRVEEGSPDCKGLPYECNESTEVCDGKGI